jgi:hypothetical protein
MFLSKDQFNSRDAQRSLKSQNRKTERKIAGEDNAHHRNSDLKEKVMQTPMYRALHNSQKGIWLRQLRRQRNRREV